MILKVLNIGSGMALNLSELTVAQGWSRLLEIPCWARWFHFNFCILGLMKGPRRRIIAAVCVGRGMRDCSAWSIFHLVQDTYILMIGPAIQVWTDLESVLFLGNKKSSGHV